MAISINPSTYVITIPQADLTLIGGSSYQLDTNVFRIALRDWEDSVEGIYQPKTHNHNTSVSLGGIQYARVLEILSPYTVTFEETGTPYVVSLTGSNNNILEKTNLGSVQLLSNNSAGLINVNEVQFGAFDNHVTIDVGNVSGRATAGITYPTGTEATPSNNLADAITIAEARGFDEFRIIGNLTIGATDNIANYHFYGQGAALNVTKTLVTLTSGCITTNTAYHHCRITGVQGGESQYIDCIIENVSNAHCLYKNCGFITPTGAYTLQQSSSVSNTHESHIFDGFGDEGTIIIDRNGTGANQTYTHFSGYIKFINQNKASGSGNIKINMTIGTVEIDSSCTTGSIEVTGNAFVINNSGGTTVDTTGVHDSSSIASAVWDTAIAGHLTAGTTGKSLSDASSAGNPWSTPVAGNTDAGTFGELVGKKLLTIAKFLGLK